MIQCQILYQDHLKAFQMFNQTYECIMLMNPANITAVGVCSYAMFRMIRSTNSHFEMLANKFGDLIKNITIACWYGQHPFSLICSLLFRYLSFILLYMCISMYM